MTTIIIRKGKRFIRWVKRYKKQVVFVLVASFALYILFQVLYKQNQRLESKEIEEASKYTHKRKLHPHRKLLSAIGGKPQKDDKVDNWPSFDGTYNDMHDIHVNETVAEILCKQRRFVVDEALSPFLVYCIVGGIITFHSVCISTTLLIFSSGWYIRNLCTHVYTRCRNKMHRQRSRSKKMAMSDFNQTRMQGCVTEQTMREFHELRQAFEDNLWSEGDQIVQKKIVGTMVGLYIPATIRRVMMIAAIALPLYTGLTLFWHMILPHVFSTRLGFPLEMIAIFLPSNMICTIILIKGYRDSRMHVSSMLKVFLIYFLLCMKMALPGFLSIHAVTIPSILSIIYGILLIWIQMAPLHFAGTRGLDYFTNYTLEVLNRSKDTYDAFHKQFTLQWEDIMERRGEEDIFSQVPLEPSKDLRKSDTEEEGSSKDVL